MWKSKLPEQCRYRRRVNPQTHSSLSLLAIKQRAWSVQISSAPGFHAEFITRLAIKLQSSDPRSILLLLQNCQEFINLDTKSKVAHWFQLFKEYSFFGQGNSQWPCASIKWFEMARAYSISLVLLWISSQRDIYGLASWNKTILSQHFWQLSFSICYCYGCWTSEWHIETIWLHTATIVALHHLQHLDSSPAGLNSCQQTVGETWTSPCAPYLVVYCPPSCRKVTGCLRRTILVS